jgi:ADP-heptose:LPS heptosyltransferase
MEKIIVTPLIGMGDTLMTTPALRLLKTHHPDWHITYSTISSSNYELLKGNPNIDNLEYYPLKAAGIVNGPLYIFKKFFGKYSISITFYPSNRASYNLFALLTGASQRIGHTYLHRSSSQLNWLKNKTIREDPAKHCVEENTALLSLMGISCSRDKIPDMEIFLSDDEKKAGRQFRDTISRNKVIGVHAGTSTFKNQDKRRWPKERFCELIDRFPEYHFILFGTREEEDVNRFIQANVAHGESVTLVSGRPLRETIAIIGTCEGFVSNDSGLMHIAAAMKVPTLALLGPTNEAFIYPWNVPHVAARSGIGCSPCFFYSPKPLSCIRRINYRCMQEITVAMVQQGLADLLAGNKK